MTNADRSPVLKAFGQAVRECRSARGFSQEGFAHYCGLDRSYMGGVERGERNVTLANGHFRDLAVQRDAAHLNDFAPYFRPGIPRQTP